MCKLFYTIALYLIFTNLSWTQNITEVQLTFTDMDGNMISATAVENAGDFQVNQTIELMESTEYTLQVTLKDGETDITSQINDNGINYKMFYQDSLNVFVGGINYQDMDNNELPIGLLIFWTTNCVEETTFEGPFRTVLEDLTGVKNENSMLGDGSPVLDITWNIVLQDDPNAPPCENEEEIIDKVTLAFTPQEGGDPIIAIAQDPDGPGPQDLVVEPFTLFSSTTYEMDIKFESTIAGEDITEEVRGEGQDHQIYFSWTGDLFSDPIGDGNIDNSTDPVNYEDQDQNGLPLGLETLWITAEDMRGGTFRVVLKHQPDIKSNISTAEDGGTDVDITWEVETILTSNEYLQNLKNETLLFPNLVVDHFYMNLPDELLRIQEVSIYGVNGRYIRSIPAIQSSVSVSDLASGVYYIGWLTDHGFITKSFIKK